LDFVNFASNDGFSILSNGTRPACMTDKLRDFETNIVRDGGEWQDIWQCMAHYKVPGMSVAVVQDNQLAWACSYGRVEAGSSHWVHNDTVFQAASCSKPVAAVGFLRLVQSGLIGLDENVNSKLGWTLPMRACAAPAWKAKVNLRQLLQHRGGIIGRGATWPADTCTNFSAGGGGGFRGYGDSARVGVPTVKEVLNGTSNRPGVRVNSHRVELTYKPGTMAAYSGEGYVLMMRLLEQQLGVKFADWMKLNVLDACGMLRSTYSLSAPSHSGPPASGHDRDGVVIAGKRRRYPESAAAGLYATAADLCRFIIMLNQAGKYAGATVLEESLAKAMIKEGLDPILFT
jgi:CubicO group peptidase (beta-lactamase class C family)